MSTADKANQIPTTHRVIEVTDGDYNLDLVSEPLALPKPHEVLLKVAASGINRADLLQRKGLYPPPEGASSVMGLEVSGTVLAVGADVTRWKVGDTVCALTHGGGYADYVCVPAGQCLPVPKGISLEDAAALPEAAFTVWHNIFQRAKMQAGEAVLIHGGASGIGSFAIPLVKAMGGTVFTTAGTAEKCAVCESWGADRAINYREEDFEKVIKSETGGKGVNVILDIAAGDYIQKNINACADEGRIVTIAFIRGAKAEVNFAGLLMKRLTMTGSSLRAQSLAQKTVMAQELEATVWPLIEQGLIVPVIDSRYTLADAEQAQARMSSGEHTGKILMLADA